MIKMDVCRVCMVQKENMTVLFVNESENILKQIEFCTGIMLRNEDGLPKQICSLCVQDLTTAYNFKILCITAEETFKKIVTNGIKTEYQYDELKQEDDSDYSVIDNDDFNYDVPLKEENQDIELMNKKVGFGKEEESTVQPNKKTRGPCKKRTPYKHGKRRLLKLKYRRLYCEVCDIKFTSRAESDQHKIIHKEQATVCEVCGKVFAVRSTYYSHVRTHQTRQYLCAHCNYGTANKYDLVKHLHVHLGIKTYKCSICFTAHRTISGLHEHVRRAHERVRRFSCHICGQKFFERHHLNRHIDAHSEIKRYECEVCHSCFTRRCYWKKHLARQHSIVVPDIRPGRRPQPLTTNAILAT